MRRQIVGADSRQRAPIAADGGANSLANESGAQEYPSLIRSSCEPAWRCSQPKDRAPVPHCHGTLAP
jgi:hypothetical protein